MRSIKGPKTNKIPPKGPSKVFKRRRDTLFKDPKKTHLFPEFKAKFKTN